MRVTVLYNQHPDAPARGYRPGDQLERVYDDDIDLPANEIEAVAIVWGLFNEDREDKGAAWDEHRAARIGELPPRDLTVGDVVIVEGERAYACTPEHWEPIDRPAER
jgi:hypothetical protein